MIYVFDENAGKSRLDLRGEQYKYLIKVRRHTLDDVLFFRNPKESQMLYGYKITSLEPRSAVLELQTQEQNELKSNKKLHLAWCVIDPKSVEKVLPSLCEMGVEHISFILCQRSQKNFMPDFKRLERIVYASMQQSGRTSMMEFDSYKSIADFIEEFPDTKVFDFCENSLGDGSDLERVLIGCEGGFSDDERALLQDQDTFRLATPMVLRSESAAVGVVAKILL